jgi:hypothetical protein
MIENPCRQQNVSWVPALSILGLILRCQPARLGGTHKSMAMESRTHPKCQLGLAARMGISWQASFPTVHLVWLYMVTLSTLLTRATPPKQLLRLPLRVLCPSKANLEHLSAQTTPVLGAHFFEGPSPKQRRYRRVLHLVEQKSEAQCRLKGSYQQLVT